MDTNLQELREKIKGHILAIREEVNNAGYDTSYISMASFEGENGKIGKYRNTAFIYNGLDVESKQQFEIFYDFTEEEP